MTIKDPFIFNVLDISTGHMTKKDGETLQKYEAECKPFSGYELRGYGWLVYVGAIMDNWSEAPRMSGAFRNVLRVAKKLGCDYVRFDRDGKEYEELPQFNW